jgi:hypothetical protein
LKWMDGHFRCEVYCETFLSSFVSVWALKRELFNPCFAPIVASISRRCDWWTVLCHLLLPWFWVAYIIIIMCMIWLGNFIFLFCHNV